MGSAHRLQGRVAVVAGATQGTGRGIAVALGEAGATVVCTGRSIDVLVNDVWGGEVLRGGRADGHVGAQRLIHCCIAAG